MILYVHIHAIHKKERKYMSFTSLEMSIAAMIPALLLAAYVFFNDKVEKEPVGLVALLLALGGAVYFPAHGLENFMIGIADKLFADQAIRSIEGVIGYQTPLATLGHGLLVVFVAVALVEEVAKWLITYFVTRNNKNFNCLFDGIVYATFVSLGFGMVENVSFAFVSGWDTLLLRSLYSVPVHLFSGIVMGYCYTMWRVYKTACKAEQEYSKAGLIEIRKPFSTKKWFFLMIFLPVIVHGVQGFGNVINLGSFSFAFYIFNAAIFLICLAGVRKIASKDTFRGRYADKLLDKKYPEISGVCDDVENISKAIDEWEGE